MTSYAELHMHSSYSFLAGASSPLELVTRAQELELRTVALTDYDGFSGVVRFTQAAKEHNISTVIGSTLRCGSDGPHLVVLAKSPEGYRALSREIGRTLLAAGPGKAAHYDLDTLAMASKGRWYVLTGSKHSHAYRALRTHTGVWAPQAVYEQVAALADRFGRENLLMELVAYGDPLDRERRALLRQVAQRAGIACVATGDVRVAQEVTQPLADVLQATKHNTTLEKIRSDIPPRAMCLRSGHEMAILHRDYPQALDQAVQIGQECAFDFSLVSPQLPPFPVPNNHTVDTWLAHQVIRGAEHRYGSRRTSPAAWALIDHELAVIRECGFSGYFLIVHEIVEFCRQENIWCQGRGSAANSAVCFALGITAVDAVKHQMLFERFLSPERQESPDIDLDIEAGQRERVIQHIYQRYGRTHAAQVANIITYRWRSAVRDSARALGYFPAEIAQWRADRNDDEARQRIPKQVRDIAQQMANLPRHRGIHSGGMVICDRPIIEVCPVGWATKAGRTVLQWDKEDCAEVGLVKFDLLGLGMLTALRLAFTPLQEQGITGVDGKVVDLHNIGQDDERVYDLLCAADTVGVFQVESRAQMATLPRLRPRTFYDIVIGVALIRPGPIQGGSVHPYISRRRGRELVTYAHPLLKPALEKTLGVPLFQEQLMRIAIDTAGFSPAQADRLRRAMSAKRSHEQVAQLHDELIAGMRSKGISADVAMEIFHKLDAFADFGFPESHAFSFAYLVYASAWLKVHHPEHFYASLLAAQPMGFYSPQSLIADARLHGINILPVDVCHSDKYTSVQTFTGTQQLRDSERKKLVSGHADLAVRLGLAEISGLGKVADRIIQARSQQPFISIADLADRAQLTAVNIEILATAGALKSLNVSRRAGIWAAQALAVPARALQQGFQPVIPGLNVGVVAGKLPEMTLSEEQQADYYATGITPHHHPLELVRKELGENGILTITAAMRAPLGKRVQLAGCITHRQRPSTAGGITFLSVEDETGMANIVVSSGVWQRYKNVLQINTVVVRGMVERHDGAANFIADGFSELDVPITPKSRDFR